MQSVSAFGLTSGLPAALLAFAGERLPTRQLDTAHVLQSGIHNLGYGPATSELARVLAAEIGIGPESAVAAISAPPYVPATEANFILSEQIGVRGFPAVFLHAEQTAFAVANGYVDLDRLSQNVLEAQAQFSEKPQLATR